MDLTSAGPLALASDTLDFATSANTLGQLVDKVGVVQPLS